MTDEAPRPRANMLVWLGRVGAVAAVLFGLLIAPATFTYEGGEQLLIGGAAVLCLGGGAAYLFGLERIPGDRGRLMRIGGWMLLSLGLLLPTTLFIFQIGAIAAATPAAFIRDPRAR